MKFIKYMLRALNLALIHLYYPIYNNIKICFSYLYRNIRFQNNKYSHNLKKYSLISFFFGDLQNKLEGLFCVAFRT